MLCLMRSSKNSSVQQAQSSPEKNSLHQSTAINMPPESEKNEELVEQERRKAVQAHIEFVQAEQSLAAQREACQRRLAAIIE